MEEKPAFDNEMCTRMIHTIVDAAIKNKCGLIELSQACMSVNAAALNQVAAGSVEVANKLQEIMEENIKRHT